MAHDLIAELEGYRAEQARYVREGRKDRAAAAAAEADRVVTAIGREAEKLAAQADNHAEAGQDLLAAKATVEARRLRRALAELGRPETADDKTPRETTSGRRGRNA